MIKKWLFGIDNNLDEFQNFILSKTLNKNFIFTYILILIGFIINLIRDMLLNTISFGTLTIAISLYLISMFSSYNMNKHGVLKKEVNAVEFSSRLKLLRIKSLIWFLYFFISMFITIEILIPYFTKETININLLTFLFYTAGSLIFALSMYYSAKNKMQIIK